MVFLWQWSCCCIQDTDHWRHIAGASFSCCAWSTYIDHSIGSDAEKGGSLVNCLDLFSSLQWDFQSFQFTQGTLQGGSMLGDQVITSAEVIKLADKYLQGALAFVAVRLRCWFLISWVIWKGEIPLKKRLTKTNDVFIFFTQKLFSMEYPHGIAKLLS